jgi:hypothetical protein
MPRVYDTDNPSDLVDLQRMKPAGPDAVEALPRTFEYASHQAFEHGLIPMESYPDMIIPEDEWPDRLAEAHRVESLPIYHMQRTWCPKGTRWNQNGLGYCWTWGGTAALMCARAAEDKDTVQLAPVSAGYLVGWANRGNYLSSYVKGCRDNGIAPTSHVPDSAMHKPNPRLFADGWDTERRKYRLDKTWDCRPSAMTQHCVSGLLASRAGYIAYNWWGHALCLVSLRYEGGRLQWDIRNSHNETDVITLTGSRAVPDECIFFVSTKNEEAE